MLTVTRVRFHQRGLDGIVMWPVFLHCFDAAGWAAGHPVSENVSQVVSEV